jgi:hypothetical protein
MKLAKILKICTDEGTPASGGMQQQSLFAAAAEFDP